MTPEEIKAQFALRRKTMTMTSLANKLGVTQTAVSLVIDKKAISHRIMHAVADAIEQPVEDVFPEYFRKAS